MGFGLFCLQCRFNYTFATGDSCNRNIIENYLRTKNQHLNIQIMNSGKVVLGVLAGIAAGAALGILFAHDKGSRTRRRITDKVDEYGNEIKGKYSELSNMLTKKYDQVKSEADDFVSSAKSAYNDNKDKVSS